MSMPVALDVLRHASHESLPITRSWRAVHWLLRPRYWFIHDYVLYLAIIFFSACLVSARILIICAERAFFISIMTGCVQINR